ncbi:hypothetical protein Agub_g6977 [Astrephomene gubernaculifera]|uniref:Uncharacterized protein n=1 Tax=Astrephomene gubernaculifera TaxID=47775 RepID=A0AAD3DPR9_9CHLO|nr:hypothetical protein Agub_g6977 [Astrephomene gubernaculifera]
MGCLPSGLVDWDAVYSAIQPHATFAAGVLFGLAWWIWGDALVVSIALHGASFAPLSLLPGLGATAAVLLMNCVSRQEVAGEYLDEAATTRAKLLLLLSYLVSLGSLAGAVALLLAGAAGGGRAGGGGGGDTWVGASGVLQCCLVLASGMLCWFFHAEDSQLGGYSYL